jgi:NAD(P)-dependent dehydrogenase (short-subunit alcohol dehydrogenase family)
MERYQSKRVVIIGGTSGMGLATAKMLIEEGARVLVTGLSKAGLDSGRGRSASTPSCLRATRVR